MIVFILLYENNKKKNFFFYTKNYRNIESNLNKMSITNMKTSNLPVRSKSITRPLCGGQQQQQPSTSKENF